MPPPPALEPVEWLPEMVESPIAIGSSLELRETPPPPLDAELLSKMVELAIVAGPLDMETAIPPASEWAWLPENVVPGWRRCRD